MPDTVYDLIVIGGGIAGLASASFAAGLGKKVLLVERDRIGGSCTLKTCMPTKSLIRSSVLANGLKRAIDYGLKYKLDDYSGDDVFPYIKSVIDDVNNMDTPESFNRIGIETVIGTAEFLDNKRIQVGDAVYHSHKFLIATGSRSIKLGIEGADHPNVLNIDELFKLSKLPSSIIVVGGGSAGIELGLALRLLGLEVVVLESASNILGREDQEIVDRLREYVDKLGLKVVTGCTLRRIECTENGVKLISEVNPGSQPREYSAEKALITIGRAPNIDLLRLDKAKVAYSAKGIIVDGAFRTSRQNIFAAGDVTGLSINASMVEKQALLAANSALVPIINTERGLVDVVSVIYTEPPLARFGLTEVEAIQKYGKHKISVYKYEYRNLRRAKMERQDFGLAKIICRKNGKIIGAHIWGERAEELIHEIHLLRVVGKPLKYLHNVSHAYPTFGEGILKRLGDMAYVDDMSNNPIVRLGLRIMPGFQNKLKMVKEKL